MKGVNVDTVQVVTGASEALLILVWLAAEPRANVILPQPGFMTFSALPESLLLCSLTSNFPDALSNVQEEGS